MNFHSAALDLKDLRDDFSNEKERIVDECLENGKILCDKWGIEFERRKMTQKKNGWWECPRCRFIGNRSNEVHHEGSSRPSSQKNECLFLLVI